MGIPQMDKRRAPYASNLAAGLASLLEITVLAGALALAMFFVVARADAASGLCASGLGCERPLQSAVEARQAQRYQLALQRRAAMDGSVRRIALSDQDYSNFSGIGVIVCTIEGQTRSSTAFLVGAFDIGVTVAHTFGSGPQVAGPQAQERTELRHEQAAEDAPECVYNSTDAQGQIRERIPVSYVKSQWSETGAYGEPTKNLAVVRLSRPSRYAQRTMPLGRFSGRAAPVVMVGFRSDATSDTIKRKARGTAYEHAIEGAASGNVAAGIVDFTHEMDARGIAPGAPVIDERSGVIIGIHTRLPSSGNAMITMNEWLEATLRSELQSRAELQDSRPTEARAN